MNENEIQRTFTEEQAAEFLQIKTRTLAEERRRGRIFPYRIVGNRVRYTIDQLQDYLKNHPLNEPAVTAG